MYNYKHKMYANEGEVVLIDGKFSAARITKYKPHGLWRCNTLYYMHEGSMYSTDEIFHDFYGEEHMMFLSGRVPELIKNYGCHHEPCSTFLQDFRVMRTKQKRCTAVAVGTDHSELVHYKDYECINVHSTRLGSTKEYIEYASDGFIYSTEENDLRFRGFPDLQDTSVQMNILMLPGKVEIMQELAKLFKFYTARMDIKYED